MRDRTRNLLPVVVIAVAMVGAVGWAYSVWRSPHRNDLATYGQYLIALAVLVGSIVAGALRRRASIRRDSAPPTTAELDNLADQLAMVVNDEWTRAASDRGLLMPEPIPVRWRWPSVAIAGPASAAAGTQWFQPLPGMNRVTAGGLKEGEIRDLHKLYGGLGSGRLVIAGAPGSGKSGAAVLLILAALRHREKVDEADRPKVPVPVMFTMHGWNPDTQPVQGWLAVRLGQLYPQLAGRGGALKAALLLSTGKIAVILDGLDEIPEKMRPVALRGLSQQATFRLVILTRLDEMAAAAAEGHLAGAAAAELQDIDATTAAQYLRRVQLDPAPPGWNELTDRLRQEADSSLAEALSTPLTLTLVRDTYREGDSVRELLDLCASAKGPASRDDIVHHLLDRVLPAAYTQRPGHSPLTYDLQTAQNALQCIAAQMNQDGTRDLAWWHVPSWAPPAPRVLISGLAVGVVVGLGTGLLFGLVFGLGTGIVAGMVAGIVFEVAAGVGAVGGVTPQRIELIGWRDRIRSRGLTVMAGTGLGIGLLAGLLVGVVAGPGNGFVFGLMAGLWAGLLMGLLASGRSGVDRTSSFTPLTAWRNDQAFSRMVGLAFGLGAAIIGGLGGALGIGAGPGIITGVEVGPKAGIVTGIVFGVGVAVVIGLGIGLRASATWPTSLAFMQLARRWRTPLRIMRLLEDAHQRGVLRTIGPVYQFRHARLQDRLAKEVLAVGPASTAERR